MALRRAIQGRGKTLVDANQCLRRLISQAPWEIPDVWNAFAGPRPTALAVLGQLRYRQEARDAVAAYVD